MVIQMIDIEGFRNYLFEEELSANTIYNYTYAMKKYSRMFDEVTKPNAIAFKKSLMEQFKPKSVNNRITALMRYCKYKDIPVKLKQVKEQKKTHIDNVITKEQYEKLLQCLKADGKYRYAVFVMLIGKTGMRISEALRVTKKDILNGSVTMFTKGHMRTIYFPKSLVTEIGDFIEPMQDTDKIMQNRYGKPLTSRGMSEILKRMAKKYDIPKEVMHAHAFRHFFAIEFLKRNNNIALLADVLGHSDVKMTQLYLRQSQEQQQDAVDRAVDW